MNPFANCATIIVLAALSSPVLAHPSHGADAGFAAGFTHPFFGLDHLLAMVAAGIWAAQLGGRALSAAPISVIGAMVIGFVLGAAGVGVPHVEPMIAASVLALGLLIAAGSNAGPLASALLVSVFAVFHGVAHGAEVPGQEAALVYVLGFVFASTLLQALGITMATWGRIRIRLAGAPIALIGCWMLANALA